MAHDLKVTWGTRSMVELLAIPVTTSPTRVERRLHATAVPMPLGTGVRGSPAATRMQVTSPGRRLLLEVTRT